MKKEPKVQEFLYMTPSNFGEGVLSQSLTIASVISPDGSDGVSVVSLIQSSVPDVHLNFTRFRFTKEEVMIVIKALQESLEWLEKEETEKLIQQIGCDYGK